MDDLSGFFKQVPIGLIIAPVFFAVLYFALLAFIVRRGAERRRKRREAMMNDTDSSTLATTSAPRRPPQAIPAPKTVPQKPAALAEIPEPDLDLLVIPSSVAAPEVLGSAVLAPETDWMRALETISDQPIEVIKMPTSTAPEPGSGAPAGAVELLRVYRDLDDGTLIVRIGEQNYRAVSEIGNPDLLRRFTAVVRDLWNMVNNSGARASVALPAPESGALPPPDGSVGMKARVGLLNQSADDSEMKPPGVLRQLGRAAMGQSNTPKVEIRSTGIADAVEEYLQLKLSSHPEFNTRSIHIRPAADGGVRIEVDGHYFDGIGDVVDPDAREFLFKVMREWEARQ